MTLQISIRSSLGLAKEFIFKYIVYYVVSFKYYVTLAWLLNFTVI